MKKALSRILFGADGLRPGWGVALFVCTLAALGALTHLVLGQAAAASGPLPPQRLLISGAISASFVLIATGVVKAVERRSWRFYGLGGGNVPGLMMWGWGAGIVTIFVAAAALFSAGLLHFDRLALHGAAVAGYGAAWLICLLLGALFEELLFRGYLQATLGRVIGFWPAAVLTSIGFAAAHEVNGGETLPDIAGIMMVALSLCQLLRVTGSLWLGIAFHGSLDWSQAYLFSLPDNGVSLQGHLLAVHFTQAASVSDGRVTPLISLFISVVIGLGGMLLAVSLRKRGNVPPPQASSTVPAIRRA